jgi:outer membrane protein OmpA-like peptidoglycan-associated protein
MSNRGILRAVAITFGVAAALYLAVPGPATGQEGGPAIYTSAKDVSDAQSILVYLGHLKAGSFKSGTLDQPTSQALVAFQGSHTLPPNGMLDWETMTQLLGHQPPVDSDGDGVWDTRDKCPKTPKGAKVDANGCPKDSDGDGVFDGLDKCPDTPKGVKVDAEGCPMDSDHDGVFDGLDKCPDTPKGAKVDASGCPKDSDGDGVADGLDKCPDTPKGVKVDATGCPLDSDGDGVYDGADQCPDTPKGTKVDAKGCPLEAAKPAPASPFTGTKRSLVLEGTNFETNSAKLKPEAMETLDKVAEALKAYPEIRVQVNGHTDSTGNAAHNKTLSKQRADSVRDYLSSKGVAPARMETNGVGSSQPIADNKTEAGRAKNRRVELKRID